jgi:hypothetical protein
MNDPFINWVNIDVPYKKAEEISKIKEDLNKPELKKEFSYTNITGYYKYPLNFIDNKNKKTYCKIGRSVNFDNPILEVILNERNIIKGKSFTNNEDIGLIVTEKFLNDLNYNTNASFVFMSLAQWNNNNADIYASIPLPIIAVVHELPDLCDFATTTYFYNQRMVDIKSDNPFSPSHTNEIICFIQSDSTKAIKFKKEVDDFCKNDEVFKKLEPYCSIERNTLSYQNGFNISISIYPEPDSTAIVNSLFSRLLKAKDLSKYSFIQMYNYKLNSIPESEYRFFDNLSVNFTRLDKLRDFRSKLFELTGITIDMAQINSKENFNFVSRLTRIMSLILLGFSILSISLFVSNLLKNHLQKIKMNIGTFKAFGLYDITLKKIYLSIMLTFIIFTTFISLVFSWIFGISGGIRLILYLLNSNLEKNQNYYKLFDTWTFIAIFAIIIINYVVILRQTKRILDCTPGDLIYERE